MADKSNELYDLYDIEFDTSEQIAKKPILLLDKMNKVTKDNSISMDDKLHFFKNIANKSNFEAHFKKNKSKKRNKEFIKKMDVLKQVAEIRAASIQLRRIRGGRTRKYT